MNFFIGAGETPRRNGNNGNSADSHNRLFGDDGRSSAPIKNHQQSSIPFGNDNVAAVTNGNGHATNGNGNGTNGNFNGNGTNGHTNGNGNITHSQRNNKSESVASVNKGLWILFCLIDESMIFFLKLRFNTACFLT